MKGFAKACKERGSAFEFSLICRDGIERWMRLDKQYVVEMKEIKKSFGSVQAVKKGMFTLNKGEIHSLIGENGAGKSTMMKMLYGMYPFDEGEVFIEGKPYKSLSPKTAIEAGIGMVHQEFMLVKELTVLENIILGFEPKKGMTIDFDAARKMVNHYIEQYAMDVQLDKKVSQISVGEAQRVEIIKILTRGANIIILDEPTAVLTPQEAKRLFEILNNLKADGKSIVFISHKLGEIMEISDRISVMKQGTYMGTLQKTETNPLELTKLMVGREVFLNIPKKETKAKEVVLEVNDVWISGEKEISKIRGLSFEVRSGEIVGIAGIDGNGQSELIEAITGLRKVEKGNIVLGGTDITNKSVKEIRSFGLTHVPEDRNKRGLNREFSIADNLMALDIENKHFVKRGALDIKKRDENANSLIEKFDIRPARADIKTASLSGGNAQKVIVAREVNAGGKLLVASQPTRGVDIGAIESIRKILVDVKERGLGVLLVSADLEEVMSLSDRIVVMHEGRITGQLSSDEVNEEVIGLKMMGGNDETGKGETNE